MNVCSFKLIDYLNKCITFDKKNTMVTPIIYTGEQLKHLRELQGVTIYSLSKHSGVAEQQISEFEQGKRTIYVSTLAKLLTALNGLKINSNE